MSHIFPVISGISSRTKSSSTGRLSKSSVYEGLLARAQESCRRKRKTTEWCSDFGVPPPDYDDVSSLWNCSPPIDQSSAYTTQISRVEEKPSTVCGVDVYYHPFKQDEQRKRNENWCEFGTQWNSLENGFHLLVYRAPSVFFLLLAAKKQEN